MVNPFFCVHCVLMRISLILRINTNRDLQHIREIRIEKAYQNNPGWLASKELVNQGVDVAAVNRSVVVQIGAATIVGSVVLAQHDID